MVIPVVIPNKGIFIVGAKRTPFCKYGGSLRETTASHLFAAASREAISCANIDSSAIDHTIVGNVKYLSQCDGGKTPRYCGIYSGVPIDKPALGVNKACGSGLQAVINGALEILTGLARVTLTGGTELMSSQPHLVRNVRFGTALGDTYKFEDHIETQFINSQSGLTLQKAAEELAKKYGVTRDDADQCALKSHLKWKAAQDSNIFNNELANVTTTIKKKEVVVTQDELPSADFDSQKLVVSSAVLDGGSIISHENSAGPADGAAAVLLADEETATTHQLSPLARVSSWTHVAGDPNNTGFGAVTAANKLFEVTGLGREQVDLFEINDIFASQAVLTIRQLDIDPGKVNVHGGATTLGHPVAATAARMVVHIAHEMRRRNLKNGVVATSCGGGQGIAMLLQAIM